MITRTHKPSQTHSVFPNHNAEKTRLTPLSKNYFFCSLLLSLPPKHFLIIFSGNQRPKIVKKLPKGEKKDFFFYNLFNIFPLLSRKKTKPLTFSALFVTGNRKTARENVPLKIFLLFFFFLLFCILPLRVIEKITTYIFFSKFRLKVPETAAKRAQVSFFTNYIFPQWLREHIHIPAHTTSFRPIMTKKRA